MYIKPVIGIVRADATGYFIVSIPLKIFSTLSLVSGTVQYMKCSVGSYPVSCYNFLLS